MQTETVCHLEPLKPPAVIEEECSPVWMYEDDNRWETLWKVDNSKLEVVLTKMQNDDVKNDVAATIETETNGVTTVLVPVLGEEYEVDVTARTMKALFTGMTQTVRRVRRATWFYKGEKGLWFPYSEDQAQLIENKFKAAPGELERADEVSLLLNDGENKIVMRRRPQSELKPTGDGRFMEEDGSQPSVVTIQQVRASTGLAALIDKVLPSVDVKRGYGDYKVAAEEEALGEGGSVLPVVSVIFVCHGIGEHMWSRKVVSSVSCLEDSVKSMNAYFLKARLEAAQRQAADIEEKEAKARGDDKETMDKAIANAKKTAAPDGRVLVLPVYWYKQVQSKELEVQRAIQQVTLPTVAAIRTFTNDCLLDVMFYMTPEYQVKILTQAGDSINTDWNTLKRLYPHLTGDCVAIMGHSLGSVIGYDLLQAQPEGRLAVNGAGVGTQDAPQDLVYLHVPKLAFSPRLFVGCGSPLGMFLAIRSGGAKPIGLDFKLPTCRRYMNVFHPTDPVAFRVEPLIDSRLQALEPDLVPHQGGYRLHVKMRMMQVEAASNLKKFHRQAQDTIGGIVSAMSFANRLTPTNSFRNSKTGSKNVSGDTSPVETTQQVPPAGGPISGSSATGSIGSLGGIGTLTGAKTVLSNAAQALEEEAQLQALNRRGSERKKVTAEMTKTAEEVACAMMINEGRRVDYQLQDSPMESVNPYVAAISSHGCYLSHPDLAMLLLRELE